MTRNILNRRVAMVVFTMLLSAAATVLAVRAFAQEADCEDCTTAPLTCNENVEDETPPLCGSPASRCEDRGFNWAQPVGHGTSREMLAANNPGITPIYAFSTTTVIEHIAV